MPQILNVPSENSDEDSWRRMALEINHACTNLLNSPDQPLGAGTAAELETIQLLLLRNRQVIADRQLLRGLHSVLTTANNATGDKRLEILKQLPNLMSELTVTTTRAGLADLDESVAAAAAAATTAANSNQETSNNLDISNSMLREIRENAQAKALLDRSSDFKAYSRASTKEMWCWRAAVAILACCAIGAAAWAINQRAPQNVEVGGEIVEISAPKTWSYSDAGLIFALISTLGGLSVWSARQAHDSKQEALATHDYVLRMTAIENYFNALSSEERHAGHQAFAQLMFSQSVFGHMVGSEPTDPSIVANLLAALKEIASKDSL